MLILSLIAVALLLDSTALLLACVSITIIRKYLMRNAPKRDELIWQVENLKGQGAEVIFPNPVKEAFDDGKVKGVGDIL